jgi:hypothetical protein
MGRSISKHHKIARDHFPGLQHYLVRQHQWMFVVILLTAKKQTKILCQEKKLKKGVIGRNKAQLKK